MRLIYEDKTSSFEELLEQDKSVSIGTCKEPANGPCKRLLEPANVGHRNV